MTLGDKPAFPGHTIFIDKEGNIIPRGMTLREFYAGLAMVAIRISDGAEQVSDNIAIRAIRDADALLAELEKNDKPKSD